MEVARQHNLMEETENAIEVKSIEKITELRSNDAIHFHSMACEFHFLLFLALQPFKTIC